MPKRRGRGGEHDLRGLGEHVVDQRRLVDIIEAGLSHVAEVGDADGEADAGLGHDATARLVRHAIAGKRRAHSLPCRAGGDGGASAWRLEAAPREPVRSGWIRELLISPCSSCPLASSPPRSGSPVTSNATIESAFPLPHRGTSTTEYYSRTPGHPTTPAYPHRDREGAVSSHSAVTAPSPSRSRCGLSPHFRKVRLWY